MCDVSEKTDPSPFFKRSTAQFVQQMMETGHPVAITVNAEADFVIRDAQSYRMLLDLVDRLETIERIEQGIESFERGEGIPAEKALEKIREKYGVPREG